MKDMGLELEECSGEAAAAIVSGLRDGCENDMVNLVKEMRVRQKERDCIIINIRSRHCLLFACGNGN